MIYDLKGHKVDISDNLLKDYKEEMGNISQEMIDTCAKLALLKYDDIGSEEDFKRRIKDVMFIEMVKHKDMRDKPNDVVPGKIYSIKGHDITVDKDTALLYQKTIGYPLNERGLYIYVSVALKRHKTESFSDKQLSYYAADELRKRWICMLNYWPLSEFGFSASGDMPEDLKHKISVTGDFIRKHVVSRANFEVSAYIAPDMFASFAVISGVCQFGIYTDSEIKQDIEFDPDDIDMLPYVMPYLKEQAAYKLGRIAQGLPVTSKTDVLKAWGETYKQKGLIEDLKIKPESGYTKKDVLPFQKNAMMAYGIFMEPAFRSSFDQEISKVKTEVSVSNLEGHILALSQGTDRTRARLQAVYR